MDSPSLFQSPPVTARLFSPLRGRKALLLAAAALALIAVYAGWRWFGTVAMLPLLTILPCAAMMVMCMRGHGGSANTPTTPNNGSGSGPAAGH
jgi:hypothetical protein